MIEEYNELSTQDESFAESNPSDAKIREYASLNLSKAQAIIPSMTLAEYIEFLSDLRDEYQ